MANARASSNATDDAENIVRYDHKGSYAVLTMDDGKVNAVSRTMIGALNDALDRAERDAVAVVLTGRAEIFSAGFDLRVMKSGGAATLRMLSGGFELSARLLGFPHPVVVACNGNAIAMGAFLLLSGDYRIGAEGDFKITANEVAIGMTLPHAVLAICRHRLTPAAFERATLLSEVFSPGAAREAGFLDRVVPPDQVMAEAEALASRLMDTLDPVAHRRSKLRSRDATRRAIRVGSARDMAELGWMGAKAAIKKPTRRKNG